MADENTGNTEAKVTVTEGATPDTPPYQPRDEVAKQADNPDAVQNALNAERQAAKEAKKRAEAAEAKVREFEEKDASEVEKLTKRADRAEQQRKDTESKLLRFEVASEKEVPANLVPLLTGSTKEEIESQATLLLDNLKAAQKSDFDGGVREPAPDTKTPEQQHNQTLGELLFGPAQPK